MLIVGLVLATASWSVAHLHAGWQPQSRAAVASIGPAAEVSVTLPQLGGPDGRTATCPAVTSAPVATTGGVAAPCLRWSWPLAHGAEVADLVVDGQSIVLTDDAGNVSVLRRATGQVRWSQRFARAVHLHDVVAGTIPVGIDADIRFLALTDGGTTGRFTADVTASAGAGPWLLTNGGGVLAARAVSGGTAWALDVTTSSRVWVLSNGPYLATRSVPGTDEVVRLSANTGEPRWRASVDGRVAAIHAVGSGTLLEVADPGRGSRLLLLDRTGATLLDLSVDGGVTGVAVADDVVAVAVDRALGHDELVLFPAAGDTAPTRTSLGAGRLLPGPPLLSEGVVAVTQAGDAPVTILLDRVDGEVLGRVHLDAHASPRALVSADVLVTEAHGVLAAWDLPTGRRRWSLGTSAHARLASAHPLLLVDDGALRSLAP